MNTEKTKKPKVTNKTAKTAKAVKNIDKESTATATLPRKVGGSKSKAPSPKIKPESNSKGVTEMTKEKHAYEGYCVRAQKSGHVFRQYISASDRVRTESTFELRKKGAFLEATNLRVSLAEVIDSPKSWSEPGVLRPTAIKSVKALGFVHVEPKI